MRRIFLFIIVCILFFTTSCMNDRNNKWIKEANGIWKYSLGNNDALNLLKASGAAPNLVKLNDYDPVDFPFNESDILINVDKNKIHIRLPLDKDEQIYGLGLQFKDVNRNQKIYNLRVDHYGGEDNGRTHAPVPFYVSSKGYGVLINSAQYMTIYVGTSVLRDSENPPKVYDRNTDKEWDPQPESDMIEILIDGNNAEVIVFSAKSLLDVVRKYNLYSGGGCLPPKWGLGFTYRTHTLFSAEQVKRLIEDFDKNGFPLDFIGLEPGWMNMSYPCSFEWDEGRFPEPEKFVRDLLNKGIRTNLWMNPYIAPKAKLYEPMLPYSGSHTVWNGIVPDYTLKEPRQILKDFFTRTHLNIGVSGYKIDEVDGFDNWLWPDVASFPSGISAEQMRQTYGLILQNMITDLYRENNTRTYGLIRASNAGSSRFPFVLYNDYYKHEDFITALINSSFSGLLWTPEVRSSSTGEEWLRRMQSVCFSPMAMINAWYSSTMPWSYPEVYDEVKQIALLRIQLLPYIYSAFAEYHFEGTPVVRAMQLAEDFSISGKVSDGTLDDTKNPYNIANRQDVKDQFMFGNELLIAPVFNGQKSRRVILPGGKWYDFYSGDCVGEDEEINIETKLEKIPIFVRDGGIIPMIKPRLRTPNKEENLELIVRHYGKSPGKFMLYDDDGETFNYENGDYSWTQLSVDYDDDELLNGSFKRENDGIFNYGKISWLFMTK